MITEPDMAKIKYVARRRHELCEFDQKFPTIDDLHETLLEKAVESPNWVFVVKAAGRQIDWWLHKLFPYFDQGITTVELDDGRMAFITWQAT